MDSGTDSTIQETTTITEEYESHTTETTIVEKKKKKSGTKKSKKVKHEASKILQKSEGKKIHVRSVDASQVQQKFNKQAAPEQDAAATLCKLCSKQVFQMERIKAEKAVWHKNCFSCTECQKKLTVDNYNSHEGLIYCKPHYKQLFQPKAVLDSDEIYCNLKPELIIRESQPAELPSDVVRGTDYSNYGVEDLCNLDLKSRFSVFERASSNQEEMSANDEHKHVKRSESILSRLARFDRDNPSLKGEFSKSCGDLNFQDSSSEDEGYIYEDKAGNRSSYFGPDGSVSFNPISDIKSKWEESGTPHNRREELAKQRKEELQLLRARQCQGRQLRLKEQYEQAIMESQNGKDDNANDSTKCVDPEKLRHIKDIFEKGGSEERTSLTKSPEHVVDPEKLRSIKGLFESGGEHSSSERPERQEEFIPGANTREARNMFKQMEENGYQDQQQKHRQENYGLENRETFKSTSAMLDLFRRLEREPDRYRDLRDNDEEDYEEGSDEEAYSGDEQGSENSEEEENLTVGLTPQQEEILQIARDRAVAKNMREKFERWEFSNDEEKLAYEKTLMIPESEEIQASLNTAKNLRAMFEKLQQEPPKPEKPRIKVNRFV